MKASNKSWSKRAREHQKNFKAEFLKIFHTGPGSNPPRSETVLSEDAAGQGANFYTYGKTDEWEILKDEIRRSTKRKLQVENAGLRNMLHSEHIPYNLLMPLKMERVPQRVRHFMELLLNKNVKVDLVEKIKVEYTAELHRSELLNDNTCFDGYVEFLSGGKRVGVGMQVRYAEKIFIYGNKEKNLLSQEDCIYNKLSKKYGAYKPEKFDELKQKKFKQCWRHHLLGLKLVELGLLDKFYSVLICPSGNEHQREVGKEFGEMLNETHKQTFMCITFEEYIDKARQAFNGNRTWVDYLEKRYIPGEAA
jgi:hypothetical protein